MVLRMFSPHILRTLTNFLAFVNFDFFRAFVWEPLKGNESIYRICKPYEVQIIFKNFKEEEIRKSTKNVGIPFILCSLANFFSIFYFYFLGNRLSTPKV